MKARQIYEEAKARIGDRPFNIKEVPDLTPTTLLKNHWAVSYEKKDIKEMNLQDVCDLLNDDYYLNIDEDGTQSFITENGKIYSVYTYKNWYRFI